MYSRKFNQNSIPPDYSGISFRQKENETPPAPPTTVNTDNCTREPRYPVQDRHIQIPARKFKFKPVSAPNMPPNLTPSGETSPKESERPGPTSSSLLCRSFTMEDIVLAGLILLLLNSEGDNELLLVLGFLLLVGLQ